MRIRNLLIPVLFMSALVAGPANNHLFARKLSKEQAILHALNRLTFGPRPGDVEAVRKWGLKKWIDRQLHPERIPENKELLARLEPLDTLRMSTREILEHYRPAKRKGERRAAKNLDQLVDPAAHHG